MICLENTELPLCILPEDVRKGKKLARIQASLLYKQQTNLVYLSYLADLRKKK